MGKEGHSEESLYSIVSAQERLTSDDIMELVHQRGMAKDPAQQEKIQERLVLGCATYAIPVAERLAGIFEVSAEDALRAGVAGITELVSQGTLETKADKELTVYLEKAAHWATLKDLATNNPKVLETFIESDLSDRSIGEHILRLVAFNTERNDPKNSDLTDTELALKFLDPKTYSEYQKYIKSLPSRYAEIRQQVENEISRTSDLNGNASRIQALFQEKTAHTRPNPFDFLSMEGAPNQPYHYKYPKLRTALYNFIADYKNLDTLGDIQPREKTYIGTPDMIESAEYSLQNKQELQKVLVYVRQLPLNFKETEIFLYKYGIHIASALGMTIEELADQIGLVTRNQVRSTQRKPITNKILEENKMTFTEHLNAFDALIRSKEPPYAETLTDREVAKICDSNISFVKTTMVDLKDTIAELTERQAKKIAEEEQKAKEKAEAERQPGH